jgi:hypothetical protein
MGKSRRNNQTPTSFKNNNLIINPIQISNVFNDYFINMVDSLQSELVSTDHASILLQNSFPQVYPEMINIPVTKNETVHTLASMNDKNLSGFDAISN